MSNYDYTDSSDEDDGSDSESSHSSAVSIHDNDSNVDAFGREVQRAKANQSPLHAADKKGRESTLIPSNSQKRYLTHKLHTLETDRKAIGSLMFWFIKHSHFARYLFDFLISSIINSTCAINLKLNRLY